MPDDRSARAARVSEGARVLTLRHVEAAQTRGLRLNRRAWGLLAREGQDHARKSTGARPHRSTGGQTPLDRSHARAGGLPTRAERDCPAQARVSRAASSRSDKGIQRDPAHKPEPWQRPAARTVDGSQRKACGATDAVGRPGAVGVALGAPSGSRRAQTRCARLACASCVSRPQRHSSRSVGHGLCRSKPLQQRFHGSAARRTSPDETTRRTSSRSRRSGRERAAAAAATTRVEFEDSEGNSGPASRSSPRAEPATSTRRST